MKAREKFDRAKKKKEGRGEGTEEELVKLL